MLLDLTEKYRYSNAQCFPTMSAIRKSNLWESILPSKEKKDDQQSELNNIAENHVLVYRKLASAERNHVCGVLSIKIKNVKIDSGALSTLESFARQIARNTDGHVSFYQLKHFPVHVVGNRSHPFNLVRIDVMGSGSNVKEVRLGGVLFHLHDLIRGSPASGDFPLSGVNLVVGSIELALTFNYGPFGYGISQQLADEDYLTEELIQYSLLPRINPDVEACEPKDIILKTQAVPHPDFIPFERKVYLSYGKDLEGQLEELGSKMEPNETFQSGIETIEKVRKKYFGISDRSSRLLYLHNWLQENHNRQESVPEPLLDYQDTNFPSKGYIRYLVPIITEESEPEKFFESLGKGKGFDAQPTPKVRTTMDDTGLWNRLKGSVLSLWQ